jgi:hypothetical protein
MENEKSNYSKISNQDIQIAENFFENDKHLDEFLANVSRYYSGRPLTLKTKIVEKYFAVYTKTMDFVIQARGKGKIGGVKRVENQIDTNHTLEGSIDGTSDEPQSTVQPNINSKVISNNIKENPKKEIEAKLSQYGTELRDKFNQTHGTSFRVLTPKVLKQLAVLIESGYSMDNVIEASIELKKEKWVEERNFKEMNLEYITRADKMEKYYNQHIGGQKKPQGANEFVDNYLKLMGDTHE